MGSFKLSRSYRTLRTPQKSTSGSANKNTSATSGKNSTCFRIGKVINILEGLPSPCWHLLAAGIGVETVISSIISEISFLQGPLSYTHSKKFSNLFSPAFAWSSPPRPPPGWMLQGRCRGWRSNPSEKCSQERLTRGTVTSTMCRTAHPSYA